MSNRNGLSVWRLVSILAVCACVGAVAAEKEPSTLIVTPARARIVQLVQDLFQVRTLNIVSYQTTAAATEPVLHKWDGKAWTRITVEEFQTTTPERVVLIGDQKDLPPVLVEVASRREDARAIQTFDVAAMLGAFAKLLDLSPAEVKTIAKHNGVGVVDQNEALNRYGRYYPGPGYDKLQGKGPAVSDKREIPSEPEIPPVKIEPSVPERPAPVEKTPVDVVPPAPEEPAQVDAAPDIK